VLKFYQRQKKIEPGINSDLQITGSILNEKYSQKIAPIAAASCCGGVRHNRYSE